MQLYVRHTARVPLIVVVALLMIGGMAAGLGLSGALSGSDGPASATTNDNARDGAVSNTGQAQQETPGYLTPGGAAPGHGAFNAVACVSVSKCLAVGAGTAGSGVASLTSDGGSSWSNSLLPKTTPELNAVSCGDAVDCVAVGQGALVATHDGGGSWARTIPPIAQTTLLGVSCTPSKLCVAVGISPNPGGPYHGQLFRSTDAGSTWSSVTLPPTSLGIGDVTCPSASLCIAVGAGIIVSEDGGQSWQPRTVVGGTEALRSISCSSRSHCVAIGPNPAGVYDPSLGAVSVATDDGGQSWHSLDLPPGSASLEQVVCSGPTTCLAGGPGPNGTSLAAFVRSGDGGVSWTAADPPPAATAIAGIACPGAQDCVVVGRRGAQPITATTTGGSTWHLTTVSSS